jgi:Ni/Co efflux regulator RcnB
MRLLLTSAAALALLATPVIAQPDRHDQPGGGHEEHARPAGPPAAPAAAPRPPAAPQNHGDRGDRGNHGMAQAPAAAPQAPQNRGDRQDRGRTQAPAAQGPRMGQPPQQAQRSQNNANRPGGTNFANRPGGNAGPHHNFSGFRDFHVSLNASHRFHASGYRRPSGWYAHRWTFGEFLPTAFWARDYWLIDFADYDLPPPPYGAVWVRVADDALLIDQDSGEIITVEYGVFY